MQPRTTIRISLAALFAAATLLAAPSVALAAYTPPAIKVALVRSDLSKYWLDKYNRGVDPYLREDAVTNYLRGRGWDVTQIPDSTLDNLSALRQYDVVVLQSVFAMTPQASRNMVTYVGEGGGVVNLMASPRVAPDYAGTEGGDHWFAILGNGTWEWGPLSEAYQMIFIDDMGPFNFHTTPVAGTPILTGAQAILQARGYSSSDMNIWRDVGSATYPNRYAWIELAKEVGSNTNVKRFMNLVPDTQPSQSGASYKSKDYPGTHSGASYAEYLNGRAVYFGFGGAEMLPNMNWYGLGSQPTKTSGVPQGEVLGAWMESAIAWAGTPTGAVGAIIRDGRTYAVCDVYGDGIYANQYTQNFGNVAVQGTLYFRVYDPSGRKVHEAVRYKICVEPGASYRYTQRYITSRLADGVYRVEVEYVTTYPSYGRHYVESLYVRRSAGTDLRTAYDAARTRGAYAADPRVVRYAGADRYGTALAIADAGGGYPRPGGSVVIASGGAGADALVAAGIAAAVDAPVVLTEQAALPAAVDAWIANPGKGFTNAIVVGGEGAVGPAVQARLETLFGAANVQRLAGDDRYGTAAAVALEVKERLGLQYDGSMIVANGAALSDAAGASAASAGLKRPLVLVRRDEVPTSTADAISELVTGAPDPQVWIAGGAGVVSAEVESQVESLTSDVASRAAGADRYGTAAQLAEFAAASGCDWEQVGIASGVKLADALCLGPYIGRLGGVMLLCPGTSLSTPTRERITGHRFTIQRVSIGGGPGSVSDAAAAEVSTLLP